MSVSLSMTINRAARPCPKRPRRVLSIRPSQPAPRCLADSWQLGPIRHTTHLPGQLSVANRPLCSVQLSFRLVRRRAILHSPADQLGRACRILRLHDMLMDSVQSRLNLEQVCLTICAFVLVKTWAQCVWGDFADSAKTFAKSVMRAYTRASKQASRRKKASTRAR